MTSHEDPKAVLAAVREGYFEPLDGFEESLGAGREADAWRCAFDAMRALAGLTRKAPPVQKLGLGPPATTREAGAIVMGAAHLAQLRWLDFDAEGLAPVLGTLSEAAACLPSGETADVVEARLLATLYLTTDSIRRAPDAADDEALRAVGQAAASAQVPSLVVDATTLRALLALGNGDFEEATKLARRASRMARTEGLPQQEYFANLVLARVRRMTGRPHLATRILAALARIAPWAWHPWIGWELVMAGGSAAPLEPSVHPFVRELDQLLSAARTGDRAQYGRAHAALGAAVSGWDFLRTDLEHLHLALDPLSSADPAGDVMRWRHGLFDEPPYGLSGVGRPSDGGSGAGQAVAAVIAFPEGRATRALSAGARLGSTEGKMLVLPQTQRRQGRTDSALAALALAGADGLDERDLFARVYGFPYVPNVHRDVLHVLIHRTRQRLGDAGEIRRDEHQLTLDVGSIVVLSDPRCSPRFDDRVLQFVAEQGGASAKNASQELGISLRSAQAALQSLVEEGLCTRERSGGSVEYTVEDTTFQEPTKHR